LTRKKSSRNWCKNGHAKIAPSSEIKYRFALDEAGKTVDVLMLQDHESIAGRTFRCLACEESIQRTARYRQEHVV
jgi:hypothetical protein